MKIIIEKCMGRDPPHRKETSPYEHKMVYTYYFWIADSLLPA